MSISYKNKVNAGLRKRALLVIPVTGLIIGLGAGTVFGNTPPLVTINTVTIGSPGNAADTTGYGAVNYTYQIGTCEVTNAQYAVFLNAVVGTGTDTYGLYNDNMGSNDSHGGITREEGVFKVKSGFEEKPVNYVSFYDAVRFTNWLTNGATAGASTETGVYNLSVDGTVSRDLTFDAATLWMLPSEDEWYKAAFYNTATGQYSLYSTGKSDAPVSGTDANFSGNGGRAVNVGSYAAEQNGTHDMAGNVWEWNDDTLTGSTDRLRRGGSFSSGIAYLAATSDRAANSATSYQEPGVGFRVAAVLVTAAVPEPGAYAATAGLMMLVTAVWIRRNRVPVNRNRSRKSCGRELIPMNPSSRPPSRLSSRCSPAFTLIELLTAIAIIGILAGILIPTVGKVRESARSARCASNQRQIAVAILLAAQEQRDVFPPALDETNTSWTSTLQTYFGNRESGLLVCPSRSVNPPVASEYWRSSYSLNPIIMVDLASATPRRVLVSDVQRPTEIILVADGGQRTSGSAHDRFWEVDTVGNRSWAPVESADNVIDDGPDSDDGTAHFRFRHGGRVNVAFADGHAGAFAKGTIRQRNLHTRY
jgi:prepilin-type processing-associated H-X9-DG protein/prepilin-type N-terminal cleavage/methylation domain-containing protein